jgi:hypothetical protein
VTGAALDVLIGGAVVVAPLMPCHSRVHAGARLRREWSPSAVFAVVIYAQATEVVQQPVSYTTSTSRPRATVETANVSKPGSLWATAGVFVCVVTVCAVIDRLTAD